MSRESSVVDYFISSPNLLKYFSDFEIHEQSKLFSDVHRPIGVTVSNGIDTVEQQKKQKPPANIVYKIKNGIRKKRLNLLIILTMTRYSC